MTALNSTDFNALLEKVRGGTTVWTHSGKVKPGGVFIAIPGTRHNGADYIPQALEQGAGYVVAKDATGWPEDAKAELVLHPDPAVALGELASAYFKTDERNFKLVGVTGTNGKTTVSYIIEYLQAANEKRVGVLGTINYRWPSVVMESQLTTPDCLKIHELFSNMARADIQAAVMEVSSHALDQNRIAGLKFDVAVMTNLTQDHLDYHHDMESYFKAKSKLFGEYLAEGGKAVLNYDDPWCARLLQTHPDAIGYGVGTPPPGNYKLLRGDVLSCSSRGVTLDINFDGETTRISSPLIGLHNARNILAAYGAGLCLGMTPKEMKVLNDFYGVPGRLERIPNKQHLDIFVDYAHTPDALENVLSAIRELVTGRLLVVFGCGGNRDREKRPLMGRAVCAYADVAYLTSDNPRFEEPLQIMADVRPGLEGCNNVVEDPDRREAIRMAITSMQPGDILVVAGKGHEQYQQIDDLKFPFSDAKVIKEILECD
ncbi:MAG: UDP-N-acetylmuramoyl-L-alanyl-D-glutamate--2,6-diaminopimelate ligase [Desulfovibrio sp.]|uniref:UDP-N-acetylmuramoyl-L-alanyl-D-glutamate--2, 6-diaminopimelate ligase n=1 Tax=Desulfovibrio sp. 7SRBS1 TaxID=3378064 RepID=UPI003B3D8AD9